MRKSIGVLQDDFKIVMSRPRSDPTPTMIEKKIEKKGGLYRSSGHYSVMFQVYTNVDFSPVKAQRRELTVGLIMDAPAGDARSEDRKVRSEFWRGSNRLSSGRLVCLLVVRGRNVNIFPGIISTSSALVEYSKAFEDQIEIHVRFFDPEIELRALRGDCLTGDKSYSLLIDNSTMFEAIRPFLATLNSVEPTSLPFSRYISQTSELRTVEILAPRYALSPGFAFTLGCLAKPGKHIDPMDVNDPLSVQRARLQLRDYSSLDPSQCDAVVDVLTREVALIQGPPGTGKSFTGKNILRVLLQNQVRPVVLIAFTNQALDHMLLSLLDSKVTRNFVRIGSRSKNERIAQYTLDKLESTSDEGRDRAVGKAYRKMKDCETTMISILQDIQMLELTWPQIEDHLRGIYPQQLDSLLQPPYWIQVLLDELMNPEEPGEEGSPKQEWKIVTNKKRRAADKHLANTPYEYWKLGYDINFITPPSNPEPAPPPVKTERVNAKDKKKDKANKADATGQAVVKNHNRRMSTFFGALGFETTPSVPRGGRPVVELQSVENIWSLSLSERRSLATMWEAQLRSFAYSQNLPMYNKSREKYDEACKRYHDVVDEVMFYPPCLDCFFLTSNM